MTAIAALTVYDAENLIKTAEIATALSLERCLELPTPLTTEFTRLDRIKGKDTSPVRVLGIVLF